MTIDNFDIIRKHLVLEFLFRNVGDFAYTLAGIHNLLIDLEFILKTAHDSSSIP